MMRSRNTSVKPLSPAEVRDADVDPLFLVWIVSRSAEDLVGTVLAPVGLTGVQLRETTGGTGAPDPSGAPQRSALLPHPADRGRETGAPVGGGPVRPGPGADHRSPRRPGRSGPGIIAPTAGGHRHGPGRPAEHGGLVSTATWSPVPRNSRLRLPVTTRTTRHCWRRRTAEYQGMPQTATAAVLCWACPCPARRPGCKGPPPSTAHTDRLLLPEIRSTGTDSPEVSFDVPGVGGRPPNPLSRPFGSASVFLGPSAAATSWA